MSFKKEDWDDCGGEGDKSLISRYMYTFWNLYRCAPHSTDLRSKLCMYVCMYHVRT